MPQNVALTNAPPLRRHDMTDGNIFDVDNIQAGVHVCRDFAAQEIHDDLAARSRLHIPGSHREAGVDDHHGDATPAASSKLTVPVTLLSYTSCGFAAQSVYIAAT